MKPSMFKISMVLIFLITPLVQAGEMEIEGVNFKKVYESNGTRFELVGVGLLRYLGIFKPYVGAFYLEKGVTADQALMDRAKRLEVEYFRPFAGEDFGPATNSSIKKNVTPERFEQLKAKIDYHNSLYQDIQAGDRYSLTYIPGRGTELALNGVPKGIITGADFAAALFSIWIGERPISQAFKKALLGLK